MIRRYINCLMLGAMVVIAGACNKYLDVKPDTSILESDAYNTQQGFESHLNGVYLALAQKQMYGGMINMVAPELLAQRYMQSNVSGSLQMSYKPVADLNYGDKVTKDMFAGIWASAYTQIANLNNLLQQIDGKKSVFSDSAFNKVKGEALALRSFLYFDLLRLFGPVYSVDSVKEAIPYYTTVSRNPNGYMKANQLMDSLIRDAAQARSLLDSGYAFRKPFFNYFSATALLARMTLYRGDKASAYAYAKQVINSMNGRYGFTPYSNTAADPALTGDAVLAFQNTKLIDTYNTYYSPDVATTTNFLFPAPQVLLNCFGTEDDQRYNGAIFSKPNNGASASICIYKFAKGELIPILRASECLLIAAETAPDPNEGVNYVNQLKKARNIAAVTPVADLQAHIGKEYMREFWLEGQLFYYYKRKLVTTIPNNYDAKDLKLTKASYVVPVPDNELVIHQPNN
ncbi:RagB/SusD family nutrient uptake outer membrane protein [Chitinophaga sp. CB10]|uniref:RagB/SusD family nutrient uptake outer membrane protein n=1 Tax=Chitinophaga sp. CB10 TaxID=1891659 RepID=UPI000B00CD4D|nr:RagB/SusD family nutrient uptake outer membrane protein [Chitinophaga sp. CB10]